MHAGRRRHALNNCRGKMTVSETIGIMADSHGNADMLAAAIRYFREAGCRQMIHLGDICDSVDCDQADRCVGMLQRYAVRAVKGNNDHAVVKNTVARENGRVSGATAAYLEALPLQIETPVALFVHSRPCADVLGLSAMTGDIDRDIADRFMARYPGKVLFRGHGHSPGAARLAAKRTPEPGPIPADGLRLDGRRGWIVTCGALYKGMCMTWTPGTGRVASHRLVPPASAFKS